MQLNYIPLLTWITGLAVYVGSIRFVVIGRLTAATPPKNPGALKWFLRFLIPVDAALLTAGAALFLHIFWSGLFGGPTPPVLLSVVTWAAFIALITLILHHLYSWWRSVRA
jgi:hypothetical protein